MSEDTIQVENLHRRHEDQEKRVSVLEAQVSNIDTAVGSLRGEVRDGFEGVTKAVQTGFSEARTERTHIHQRIDEHERSSAITMPIILAFVATTITVGGVIAGFVSLSMKPVVKAQEVYRQEMRERVNKIEHVIYVPAWQAQCEMKEQ